MLIIPGFQSVSQFETDAFLDTIPLLKPFISGRIAELAEVHFDLGQRPKAIWLTGDSEFLRIEVVTEAEIEKAVEKIGSFDNSNRAGINQTLHRFSVLRNRNNTPIGLSLRFGRAHYGLAPQIYDIVDKNRSILLIGPPGVGKTSTLRGLIARYATNPRHRVMVIDTNNEIGGDGDVPHPVLGEARRMQVPNQSMQHLKMIEAVSNHMPSVICVDEVRTELEAEAVREIAQRGVIVIATAHGENLLSVQQNPSLSALLGGMKTATVGDNIAKRHPGGFQKNIVQREHDVPFDTAVILKDRETACIHWSLTNDVDKGWLNQQTKPEIRRFEATANRLVA